MGKEKSDYRTENGVGEGKNRMENGKRERKESRERERENIRLEAQRGQQRNKHLNTFRPINNLTQNRETTKVSVRHKSIETSKTDY